MAITSQQYRILATKLILIFFYTQFTQILVILLGNYENYKKNKHLLTSLKTENFTSIKNNIINLGLLGISALC